MSAADPPFGGGLFGSDEPPTARGGRARSINGGAPACLQKKTRHKKDKKRQKGKKNKKTKRAPTARGGAPVEHQPACRKRQGTKKDKKAKKRRRKKDEPPAARGEGAVN